MSTVFVSGVAGFLGSHLADLLVKEDHRVIGCDNLVGGELANVSEEVEFYQEDCADLEAMTRLTRDAEVVYHCAATAYEGLSVFSPSFITQNIVQASVSLISASVRNGVRRFVNCSSMARYGSNETPFVEEMEPRPQDPYGIGKVSVEQMLRNLCGVHGMEHVTVVPHNIIGPRQKWDDPFRNVASIMANLMLQKRQPIIYGDGEQRRCFSFVSDVAEPMLRLAFDEGLDGEVFNLGPDDAFITINELSLILADIIGVDLEPIYVPDRPMEVRFANCSADKARRRLGYKAKVPLREGLESIVTHIERHGTRKFDYNIEVEIRNQHTPRTWTERMF